MVNVAQELISIRRVADMRLQVRPLASVIRSGQLKGVPVEDVVAGDVLLIQAGDEFPADGLLLNSNGIVVIYDPSHPSGFTNPDGKPHRSKNCRWQPM